MRSKITFVILLNVILSCNGLFEKLLNPLNVGSAIIKEITHIKKIGGDSDFHSSMQESKYGGYSSNGYGGSSATSFNFGGSLGVNGNAGQSQTYGAPSQNYGYIETSQVNAHRLPEPTTVYVISSQNNGYTGPAQEVHYGENQQGGYVSGGAGSGSGAFQTGMSHNGHLTFNINLGGLFGLGHKPHQHDHGHWNGNQNQGNFNHNNNQYHPPQPNSNSGQYPGQIEEYEVTIISNKPEQGGYQNQNHEQIETNIPGPTNDQYHPGYNNAGNSHQSDDKYQEDNNDNTAGNYQSINNYNTYQNQNPSESFDNLPVLNPVQDERNGAPDQKDDQNKDKNISTEPSVNNLAENFSSTENTKTPYENEKNSKVTTSNRKTTIRPDNDQPLLIPLNPNEYSYEGDKIQVSAPKRNVEETSSTTIKPIENNTQKPETSTKEDEFDLDVRFGKNK